MRFTRRRFTTAADVGSERGIIVREPHTMTPLTDGLSHMGDGMIDAWSESYGRWDDRCMVSHMGDGMADAWSAIWAMG
jgi:hypothetical protein